MTSDGSTENTRGAVAAWMSTPAPERLDQPGVLGEMGDHPQLDLVVVGDEQLGSGAGMNASRNRRPRALRTGMLWRFGWSDERRPVRATVWLKLAWIRPSGATSESSPVP